MRGTIQGKNRVREQRQHGSVRGVPGNRHPYRDRRPSGARRVRCAERGRGQAKSPAHLTPATPLLCRAPPWTGAHGTFRFRRAEEAKPGTVSADDHTRPSLPPGVTRPAMLGAAKSRLPGALESTAQRPMAARSAAHRESDRMRLALPAGRRRRDRRPAPCARRPRRRDARRYRQ